MKREVNYSNWREDLREVVDVPPIEPKRKTRKSREVTGEGVNNKVVVNPTMAEANEVFKELGGTVLDIQETEMNMSPGEIKYRKMKTDLDKKSADLDTKIARERKMSLKKFNQEETAFDKVKKSMGKSFIDTKNQPKRQPWYKEHQRNIGKDPYTKKND